MVDQPEFSVIIPAFNVQGFLRQAVMSASEDARVEVIVVDDRSTDGTAQLAEELAEHLPTVRLVRPESNVGLGMARNLGLAHARGRYVLFVDGDDYLAAGAFDRLRGAIADGDPDVVVFGYSRLYPNGDVQEGVMRGPLQHRGAFTAAERPEIFDVLNVAWNKAYRREFLERAGIEFPVGYYEDIPWTYPLLATAQSIVGLDESLYLYRQRWSGSILRSVDERHLEIADQFERLMDVMDRLELPEDIKGEIFTRAYRNLVTLASTRRHRIPAARRQDYYERAQRLARDRVPQGYTLPTEGDKWELMHAMWERDYSAFMHRRRVATALQRTRHAIGRVVRKAWRGLRAPFRRKWVYEWHRRRSALDPQLVVLEALWGRTPRLNCQAVAQEIARQHPQARIVWSVRADEAAAMPEGTPWVSHGSRDYYRALATATYFFLDANLPGWWRKRRGQVFTQLHHGTPLKLMGVEERGKSRGWKDALLRRWQQWDDSVVSNAYSAEVWKHSYPVRCETLEYGYPRNDVLVNADPAAIAAARARVGVPDGARVALYAPTFRDRGDDSPAVGLSSEDLDRAAAALGDGAVVLVRGHYFARGTVGVGQPAVVDVTAYPSVEDLYLAADLLITDYSSTMFDYANLRRPIIIHAPDWEQYAQERGTYFDITADAPGPVTRSVAELETALATRTYEDADSRAALERFASIFCCFDTGHAARDVVSRVMGGELPEPPERRALPALRGWHMERMA